MTEEEKKDEIMAYLEKLRWPKKVRSPYTEGISYNTKIPFTYVCKDTRKKFNVLTRTHLANYKSSLVLWDLLVLMLVQGRTEGDTANALGISDHTRMKMYKKIFFAMHLLKPSRDYLLHETLIRKLKERRASKDYVFKKLLERDENII